jgi:bacteriorhodopsin
MQSSLPYALNSALILLLTTSLLTALGSVQAPEKKQRTALQLSSYITAIAAGHYFFMRTAKLKSLVHYRYLDWTFTTPLLLVELCFILDIVDLGLLVKLLLLNAGMLAFGYLGQLFPSYRLWGCAAGFVCLALIFALVEQEAAQRWITRCFFVLWSLYGLVYLCNDPFATNVLYCILDVLSKAMFGVFVYFTTAS